MSSLCSVNSRVQQPATGGGPAKGWQSCTFSHQVMFLFLAEGCRSKELPQNHAHIRGSHWTFGAASCRSRCRLTLLMALGRNRTFSDSRFVGCKAAVLATRTVSRENTVMSWHSASVEMAVVGASLMIRDIVRQRVRKAIRLVDGLAEIVSATSHMPKYESDAIAKMVAPFARSAYSREGRVASSKSCCRVARCKRWR